MIPLIKARQKDRPMFKTERKVDENNIKIGKGRLLQIAQISYLTVVCVKETNIPASYMYTIYI